MIKYQQPDVFGVLADPGEVGEAGDRLLLRREGSEISVNSSVRLRARVQPLGVA